jgi:mono/diheme cytochrome c family protein
MPGTARAIVAWILVFLFAAFFLALNGVTASALLDDQEDTAVRKGQLLYSQYCRSCHGDDARGDGPAASAFKVQPTDLTQITKKYKGFPTEKVMDYIDGERHVVGHGSREMPVWGKRFRRSPGGEKGAQSEIVLLTEYLKSIQQH